MTAPANTNTNTNTTPRPKQAAGSAAPIDQRTSCSPLMRIAILEETLRGVLGMAKLEAPHSDAWRRAVAMIEEALRG